MMGPVETFHNERTVTVGRVMRHRASRRVAAVYAMRGTSVRLVNVDGSLSYVTLAMDGRAVFIAGYKATEQRFPAGVVPWRGGFMAVLGDDDGAVRKSEDEAQADLAAMLRTRLCEWVSLQSH